jgi:hypothetical protein
MSAGSISTSGGARAIAATNSRDWLLRRISACQMDWSYLAYPTSFLASQRKGFSKLYCASQLRTGPTSSSPTLDFAEISKYCRFSESGQFQIYPPHGKILRTLAVESDVSSLDLALLYRCKRSPRHTMTRTHLDVDLVSTQDDGDVLTNSLEVTVPVGNVLVGDTRGNIEHDDTTLSLDVVSVTETAKLFLSSSVPNVEADGTKVGVEVERVDLDTESSCAMLVWLKTKA